MWAEKIQFKRESGFTIVELLIVIVVIAILAAVSIVAYSGIQDRSNDSVVQTDLANFSKSLKLTMVDSVDPPSGGLTRSSGVDGAGDSSQFPGIAFRFSRSAYDSGSNNAYYCAGTETSSGVKSFRLLVKSKSGNVFSHYSTGVTTNLGKSIVLSSGYCLNGYGNSGTWSYGYNAVSNAWFGWTN